MGGDGAHASRPRDVLKKRSVVWSIDTREHVVGGPVGRDGIAVIVGGGGAVTGVSCRDWANRVDALDRAGGAG